MSPKKEIIRAVHARVAGEVFCAKASGEGAHGAATITDVTCRRCRDALWRDQIAVFRRLAPRTASTPEVLPFLLSLAAMSEAGRPDDAQNPSILRRAAEARAQAESAARDAAAADEEVRALLFALLSLRKTA